MMPVCRYGGAPRLHTRSDDREAVQGVRKRIRQEVGAVEQRDRHHSVSVKAIAEASRRATRNKTSKRRSEAPSVAVEGGESSAHG